MSGGAPTMGNAALDAELEDMLRCVSTMRNLPSVDVLCKAVGKAAYCVDQLAYNADFAVSPFARPNRTARLALALQQLYEDVVRHGQAALESKCEAMMAAALGETVQTTHAQGSPTETSAAAAVAAPPKGRGTASSTTPVPSSASAASSGLSSAAALLARQPSSRLLLLVPMAQRYGILRPFNEDAEAAEIVSRWQDRLVLAGWCQPDIKWTAWCVRFDIVKLAANLLQAYICTQLRHMPWTVGPYITGALAVDFSSAPAPMTYVPAVQTATMSTPDIGAPVWPLSFVILPNSGPVSWSTGGANVSYGTQQYRPTDYTAQPLPLPGDDVAAGVGAYARGGKSSRRPAAATTDGASNAGLDDSAFAGSVAGLSVDSAFHASGYVSAAAEEDRHASQSPSRHAPPTPQWAARAGAGAALNVTGSSSTSSSSVTAAAGADTAHAGAHRKTVLQGGRQRAASELLSGVGGGSSGGAGVGAGTADVKGKRASAVGAGAGGAASIWSTEQPVGGGSSSSASAAPSSAAVTPPPKVLFRVVEAEEAVVRAGLLKPQAAASAASGKGAAAASPAAAAPPAAPAATSSAAASALAPAPTAAPAVGAGMSAAAGAARGGDAGSDSARGIRAFFPPAPRSVPPPGEGGSKDARIASGSTKESAAKSTAAAPAAGTGPALVPPSRAGKRDRRAKSTGGDAAGDAFVSAPADDTEACFCGRDEDASWVGCDGGCLQQWYHLSCVGLVRAPPGKWLCPACTGKAVQPLKGSPAERHRADWVGLANGSSSRGRRASAAASSSSAGSASAAAAIDGDDSGQSTKKKARAKSPPSAAPQSSAAKHAKLPGGR